MSYAVTPSDCPATVKAECQRVLSVVADALHRPEIVHTPVTRAMMMADLVSGLGDDLAWSAAWQTVAARFPFYVSPTDEVWRVAGRLRECKEGDSE